MLSAVWDEEEGLAEGEDESLVPTEDGDALEPELVPEGLAEGEVDADEVPEADDELGEGEAELEGSGLGAAEACSSVTTSWVALGSSSGMGASSRGCAAGMSEGRSCWPPVAVPVLSAGVLRPSASWAKPTCWFWLSKTV